MEDPYDYFNAFMYVWSRRITAAIGANAMDKNYRRTWRTYVVLWWMFSIFAIAAYSSISQPLHIRFPALVVLMFSIQGLCKGLTAAYISDKFYRVIAFVANVYKANNTIRDSNNTVLRKFGNFGSILIKVGMAVGYGTGLSLVLSPIGVYYLINEITPILGLMIPGINLWNPYHYAAISVYHLLSLVLGIYGTNVFDITYAYLVINGIGVAEIYQNGVDDFNKIIDKKSSSRTAISFTLRNLIQRHQEFCDYNLNLIKVGWWFFGIESVTSSICICVMIFAVIVLKYIPGIFIILWSISQLFLVCLLGTLFDIMNEKMYDAIVSINWYNLPNSEQRKVLSMIYKAQNAQRLTIFSVTPLNINTFVNISKNIYTFTMLLLQTL